MIEKSRIFTTFLSDLEYILLFIKEKRPGFSFTQPLFIAKEILKSNWISLGVELHQN